MITRVVVEKKILSYLNRQISLTDLIDWAEKILMDAEFDLHDIDLLTEIIARLGLADVREFGLTWDDCYDFLSRLGYRVQVTAIAV